MPKSGLVEVLRKIPGVYGLRSKAKEELAFLRHIWKNGLWREIVDRKRRRGQRLRQMPLTWEAAFTAEGEDASLTSTLSKRQIQFQESSHAIYIPPQRELADKLGGFVSAYPTNAGFKLLKTPGAPDHADYVGKDRSYFWAGSLIVGKALDLVPVANLMHRLGIGPRLYDFAELKTGPASHSIFVFEHIDGVEPTQLEWRQFMDELGTFIKNGQIMTTTPHWETNEDFAPPHCSHNLLKSRTDGKLYFVDTQNFLIPDYESYLEHSVEAATQSVHFGRTHLLRGGKYLYQNVPGVCEIGKRDTFLRWTRIRSLLAENHIDIKGRLVLDIGCNMGMMLAETLSEGAFWAVGWDKPAVIQHAKSLVGALGYTRQDLVPCELVHESPLAQDIPGHLRPRLGDCIVLYLAIRHHIGFIKALKEIPWRALVYEGSQDETAEDLTRIKQQLQAMVPCDVVDAGVVADGDCTARPQLLFLRRGATPDRDSN